MNTKDCFAQFKFCLCSTLIIGLIAHGYRFFNLMNSHDSMLNIVQDDIYWQRSLGRFMQLLTITLRGSIATPWLLCICSLFLLGVSVYVLCVILHIQNKFIITIMSGILVCNPTLTSSFAAFLPWVDIYATSLLLCLLGILILHSGNHKYIFLSCILFAISMGFYQAYISVAICLSIILIAKYSFTENNLKIVLKKSAVYIWSLLGGAILYFLLYKFSLFLHNVTPAQSYNSLSTLNQHTFHSLFQLIINAYKEYFNVLFSPNTFANIILLNTKLQMVWGLLIQCINVYAILVIILGTARINMFKKHTTFHWLIHILCIVTFPIASNFIYILSGGFAHDLMIYSYLFLYIYAIAVVEENHSLKKNISIYCLNTHKDIKNYLVLAPFLLIIWNSIVFSNQIYYKLHLQQEATLSIMTKIMYEVEHFDGYIHGTTPITFIGTLENSSYVNNPVYFNEINVLGTASSPLTYSGVEKSYLNYVMHNGANLVCIALDAEETNNIPVYPSAGSICYIDDILVVKLSE